MRVNRPLLNMMLTLDTSDALLVDDAHVAPLITRLEGMPDRQRVVVIQLNGRINRTSRRFRGSLALTQDKTADLIERLLDSDPDLRDEILSRLAHRKLITA